MRSILAENSARRLGRTYFLSPQISRFRHSVDPPEAKSSRVRARSRALLTVSTVWNGSSIRTGAILAWSRYFPSQRISVTCALYHAAGLREGTAPRSPRPRRRRKRPSRMWSSRSVSTPMGSGAIES